MGLGVSEMHQERIAWVEFPGGLDIHPDNLLLEAQGVSVQAHDVGLGQEVVIHGVVDDVPVENIEEGERKADC